MRGIMNRFKSRAYIAVWLSPLNTRQKQVIQAWPQLLLGFVQREWFSLFLWSSLGVLAAECVDLLLRDHSFQDDLVTNYLPIVLSDNPRHYVPYLTIVFGTMFLAILPFISAYIWRGLRSWWTGVTSGLVLLPFASSFLFSMLLPSYLHHRLILGCGAVCVWFLLSFVLYLVAKIRADRTVHEDEFKVPPSVRSVAGSQLSESDDPIQSWAQDALGRAALVDILSVKIMIAKSPVIALNGPFGSGKTSTLNLLREHLGEHSFFRIVRARISGEKVLVKFRSLLQWPVCMQPGIASVPDNFQEPCTRITAPESWKESEGA
jgi:hypothetical protein